MKNLYTMLKTIRLGFFVFLLTLASHSFADSRTGCPPVAGQPSPEAIQDAVLNARDHGFLWRISKDGRTSFLYGTIHVAKFDWMFPGPSVMQALSATDTVALELDVMDADIQGRMTRAMASSRSSALPAPLLKRMRQQASNMCVPYDTIENLSPELQITSLTVMVGRGSGLDPLYAIDAVLAGIGHGANKNMVSLETPEAQLQMLQMKDAQETVTFVQDSLADMEAGHAGTLLKRIAEVWANADYVEMARFDEWCDCLNTEIEREMMKRLLDDRNPDLADRIDVLHQSGKRVFAAVGSLHMFGPHGLPALMAKRGYRVERVDLKPQ
jgi:uncharacterized protein YbaP (TraB family)